MTSHDQIAEAVRDLCRTPAGADEIAQAVFKAIDAGIVLPTASRYKFLTELAIALEDDAARMLREYREDEHPDL